MEEIKPVLYVFEDKSVLYDKNGNSVEFKEGKISTEAKARLELIRNSLDSGFLIEAIKEAQKPDVQINGLSEIQIKVLENLVASVNSEAGRAIVGLIVLQLTIKAITPDQSVRLHKGNNSTLTFGWVEGISMRSIDSNYITPVLRNYNLLSLNKYGFMMTRTLAENYPYSQLYKASIRGAKGEWIKIIDWIENSEINPRDGLLQLLVFLNNRSETFFKDVEELFGGLELYTKQSPTFHEIMQLIKEFIDESTYSARIFEISMHALFQFFEEFKRLDGFLKPISQMRSANKKHGNIGDIELTGAKEGIDIIEAWDAKYGKSYLRDELEEINEKIILHPQCKIAGFVTDTAPNLKNEIIERIDEISTIHDVQIKLMNFTDWVMMQLERFDVDEDLVGINWLRAIAESIGQRKRLIAPIDEPTGEWVKFLKKKIEEKIQK